MSIWIAVTVGVLALSATFGTIFYLGLRVAPAGSELEDKLAALGAVCIGIFLISWISGIALGMVHLVRAI